MLKEYVGSTFDEVRLSDKVMEEALDRLELGISLDVARQVCYTWMTRSMIWAEDERALIDELRKDDAFFRGMAPLEVVSILSQEVSEILRGEEELLYRARYLTDGAVIDAMNRAGVNGTYINMTGLLAALAVSGRKYMEKEWDCVLRAEGLTAEDVARVASMYEA